MFEEIISADARFHALSEYGSKVDVDPSIKVHMYFRSGSQMLSMAVTYEKEGDYEKSFILYTKFITLFVERLPKHPDYKSSKASSRAENKKKVIEAFTKAEAIKSKLREKYAIIETQKRAVEVQLAEAKRKEEEARRQQEEEQKQLKQKQQELDNNLRQQQQHQILQEQQEELFFLQEQERLRLERESEAAAMGHVPVLPPPAYSSVVSEKTDVIAPNIPSRDLKPMEPSAPLAPSVDRSSKPDHFMSTGGGTGNQYGMRNLNVPAELPGRFLEVAKSNTCRNVETCGILSGKLANNAFHITHVLIPKQTGTADSCTTENEEDLFDYQDKYDLVTLGWIHTHPSQTAFLSSVDLHTHCSYQLMLPEALAIVCAPKFDETGFFILTPDHGLDLIANCRERGFHPHPKNPPLFEEGAHVKMDTTVQVKVVDLR